MARLSRDFYLQDTLTVAHDLLGMRLVFVRDGIRLSGMIVETEAYLGEVDLACHSSKGKTKRTEVMYGQAGHAYVYLIYGVYEMFNVVTRPKGHPEAVLVRGIEPLESIEVMKSNYPSIKHHQKLTNGPGKLTKAFHITREYNGHDLLRDPLFIESYKKVNHKEIAASKRIGLKCSKEWRDKEYRFYIKSNSFVSKGRDKT